MLAQNFKSAADLGITEPQLDALRKTLVLLETDRLVHAPTSDTVMPNGYDFTGHFNMAEWSGKHDCGTVACIGGTAELLAGSDLGFRYCAGPKYQAVNDLFLGHGLQVPLSTITPSQAATALRSYLTTGDARWDLAVS
jgi:hypothetical protein